MLGLPHAHMQVIGEVHGEPVFEEILWDERRFYGWKCPVCGEWIKGYAESSEEFIQTCEKHMKRHEQSSREEETEEAPNVETQARGQITLDAFFTHT